MALLEHTTCKIDRVNSKGLGEGSTELGLVELPYVLPGDIAEFERHGYRGKTNSILKNIIEKKSLRNEPLCKYFGACGGCLLQHFPDDGYKNFKYQLIIDALKKYDIPECYNLNEMITVPFGQRRRANLEAVKKNGQVFLGFHRLHSHQIINLECCPALLPELSLLISPLKILLESVMEDKQKLGMFVTKSASGIDISIEIQNCCSLEEFKRNLLQKFAVDHNLARLIFRYRKTVDILHEREKPYVIFGDAKVEIDSHCFLQSSDMSDIILRDIVLKYLVDNVEQSSGKGYIVDLFCGRGTYTIPLSKYFKVDGFESDAKALKAHSKAASERGLPILLNQRDLFTYPLSVRELGKYTKCIINPPRAGAEMQTKEMAQSSISEICYVSCNPDTFSRDAKILISGGYQFIELIPFDQFYFSPHLEVIGYFKK
jgi:23S rRNA (uracil1939-C5)-methyltransferase